jgi:NADH-quinone oxidoreductase subunit J
MAGLFVMLSAFFLAAVQILVTAGAVMVLFLFIIMLLDLTAMEHMPRQKIWMGCTLVLALAILLIVAKTLEATPLGFVTQSSLKIPGQARSLPAAEGQAADQEVSTSVADQRDDTHRIGRLLFRTDTTNGRTSYVAPFEITSLLILIATVGVIVLCKQEDRPRPGPREEITREAPPVEPKTESALKT